jgi:hypothetical protein
MVPALLGVALVAGTAMSANLDTSGQAGQYANSIAAVRVKGAAGDFAPSSVYAPFILLNDSALAGQPAFVNPRQAFLNTAQIQTINGIPVGYVTSFFTLATSTMADRTLAVLGTTDAAGGGVSNNVILDEGMNNKSNSPGAITPDGDIVFLERFGGNQNNIGAFTGITGVNPQIAAPSNIPPLHILDTTAPNVGNATETAINPNSATVVGSVFIGTPGADRDSNGDLYSGNTHFNGNPVLTPVQFAGTIAGVAVYKNFGNDPRAGTAGSSTGGSIGPGMAAGWLQESIPLPTNPAGEVRTDGRQTQPHVVNVMTPSGAEVIYVTHGVGFSGSTPFSGGSARVLYLVVDQLRPNYAGSNATPENNSIIIEADAVGGVGAQAGKPYWSGVGPAPVGYADHFNSDPNMRFVDHVATGGAADVSSTSRFDMNGKGQIVTILENRNVVPTQLQVIRYDPTWNAAQNRITGYTLGAIVVTNGDVDDSANPIALLEVKNTQETSPGVFTEVSLDTISAPTIDDLGRVAFVGITQANTLLGDWDANPFTPDTQYLQNTTNTLFVWEPTTGSTHRIIRGGQSGDTLTDSFAGGGVAPFIDNNLSIGVFATNSDATDAFGRGGFARTGGNLAISFRNSGNQFVGGVNQEFETRPDGSIDTFIDRGGVLYAPGQLGVNERSARGALVITLGAFAATPPCCPGNSDKVSPGTVNFDDINAAIANWLTNYGAGTGPGDGNCDGVVNFDDINSTIANWLAGCP